MWFVFPQLAGLGRSAVAQSYAIRDLDQAKRYLADPILGSRLREVAKLMMDHKDKSALQILGSPDDKQPPQTLIANYSPKRWINSTVVNLTVALWNSDAEQPRLNEHPPQRWRVGIF
jgi:uncharacterized protein (DUF1810 family)